MTFTELKSPDALTEFVNSNAVCIVTFSATWCGPCKASKPELMRLAESSPVPFGYVYESDLDDELISFQDAFLTGPITGFPSYVCLKGGSEVERVIGSDWPKIQNMIETHKE